MIPIPITPNREVAPHLAKWWRLCDSAGDPAPRLDSGTPPVGHSPLPPPAEDEIATLEASRLFDELVLELHQRARSMRSRYGQTCSWQTGDIVNEAYLRVQNAGRGTWDSRDHFLMYSSKVMRSFLVDQYRKRSVRGVRSQKECPDLEIICSDFDEKGIDLEALDNALRKLALEQPLMAKAVELRFFAGEEMGDISRILNIPKRTLERRWSAVRAWLRAQLE